MTETIIPAATIKLVRYDAMCRAISAAYKVDEVKDIRDKALAVEYYCRQAGNTEAERQACEIRLRAERKAGQLLTKMTKAKGAREPGTKRGTTRSPDGTASTLAALGITKKQSSRFQALAGVPKREFEAALGAITKPTTSSIIKKKKKPSPTMPSTSLWLWGRLRDFERDGYLDMTAAQATELMTDKMLADVTRLAPMVAAWLEELANDN